MRQIKGVLIGAVVASAVFYIYGMTNRSSFAVSQDAYEKLDIFAKVLYYVEQNYVDEVNSKDLIYGGIKGMLATLDPHTNFLPPDVFKQMKGDTSGEFGGLGIEITIRDDVLTIVAPIEDTPAWQAGIQAGDKIVKIDGDSTQGITIIEAVNKLRGKKGTRVTVTIVREGFEEPKDFTITREIIRIQSIKEADLPDGVLYTKVSTFNEKTTDDLTKVLKNKTSKKGFKGVILDLRNNPGGLLDQSVEVADLFLREGVIVSTVGRKGKSKEIHYAHKEKTYSGFPMVVLVNGASASASEIVAGALQDHKRALVVGTPTFGKGSVQTVIELTDQSALKLTVAKYYTPNGHSIQAKGITPDVVVEQIDMSLLKTEQKKAEKLRMQRERDLPHHIENGEEPEEMKKEPKQEPKKEEKGERKKEQLADLESDFQLQQAYNYLKTWMLLKGGMKESAGGTPAAQDKAASM
ncbi:MAG: S41 family peptidase [Deltaproteobacteria bacterium]|nr:S41 family peptidase [Deltaproteobacteria bacterium]